MLRECKIKRKDLIDQKRNDCFRNCIVDISLDNVEIRNDELLDELDLDFFFCGHILINFQSTSHLGSHSFNEYSLK